MVRKLIALLVLVTGLAAVGQPAQASAVDFDSVASFSSSSACATQAGTRAARLAGAVQRAPVQAKACPKPPRIVLIVPTVMLQADRARE